MSEAPAETPAPEIADTTATMQHGLKYPNGEIEWATSDGTVELSNGGAWTRFTLLEPSADLTQFLAQRAHNARLDPEMYVASHQIVARTITTLTSVPFPAPAPEPAQ